MLEIAHTWTSTGSTGTFNTPVELKWPVVEAQLSLTASTIATTNSYQWQSAQASTGPWYVEASTAVAADANSASNDVIRITGLSGWVRPVLKTASTGAYTFKLFGVS